MADAHDHQTFGQQNASAQRTRQATLPGEELTIQETLRVMDVAREIRQRRETAEQMFRRSELRAGLREKLIRTARLSGDPVTEAEIDAAIDQYLQTRHTYQDPPASFKRLLAHAWVWRGRIALALAALGIGVTVAASWFLF